MDSVPLLTTDQMASFVARGFLRLDAVVPDEVNRQALEELPQLFRTWLDEFRGVTGGPTADPDSMELPVRAHRCTRRTPPSRPSVAWSGSR